MCAQEGDHVTMGEGEVPMGAMGPRGQLLIPGR
jgi:hypothetical protein